MQSVSPEKKIPAQAVGKKKNSCKLKISLPPITFLMVHPLYTCIQSTQWCNAFLLRESYFIQLEGILIFNVPQGSLLGPLLFNIFLNDLNFAGQISSLHLYADDTTTYASDRKIIALEISLHQDLNILVTWFSQNYMTVNSIKTQGMLLGSHTYVPEFFIGDTKVDLENSLKILGVTIDNKLTFCEHILIQHAQESLCQDWCSKTSQKTYAS